MTKRLIVTMIALLACLTMAVTPSPALTIGGAVRQPLNLGLEDLAKLEPQSVRLNEITRDRQFHGVFIYRGVSLRTLLELATVQKEESVFEKPIDLAVVVKNKGGKKTVLSWGELFYRNAGEVIIAIAAVPIQPHHANCGDCHEKSYYQPVLDQLKRKIALPKLVVANDFFTDRSLEDVVSIEVVDLKGQSEKKEMKKLFSPKFIVSNGKGKKIEINDLSSYRHVEVLAKVVGDGRGYHGLKQYSGVPLREILMTADVGQEMDAAILVSSPDGYRALFSYGEIFLAPLGERIVVADSLNGKPLDEDGRFLLLPPDDLSADRDIKAVDKIEIVSLATKPQLSVIGMGPGDTSLITLEALSSLGKADVFVSPKDITRRYTKYMGGKPILFDPLDDLEPWFRKMNAKLSESEVKEKLETQRRAHLDLIQDALDKGKNVALLDWGDPTIFGGWQHWLEAEFKGRIEVVPALSAFNVANALMANNASCNGAIVISSPKGLTGNDGMIKALAERGDTLAIFMGLPELKTIVPLLKKHYPAQTPVHIAYRAGYSNSERVVKTVLGDLITTAEREKEKFLGVIYIGPALNQ